MTFFSKKFEDLQKWIFATIAAALIFLLIGSFVNSLQAKREAKKANQNIESIQYEIFLNRQAIFKIDSTENNVNNDINIILDNYEDRSEERKKKLEELKKRLKK